MTATLPIPVLQDEENPRPGSGSQSLQLAVVVDNLLQNEKAKKAGQPHKDFDLGLLSMILGFDDEKEFETWLNSSNLLAALQFLTDSQHKINFDGLYNYKRQQLAILETPSAKALGLSGLDANFKDALDFTLQEEGGYNPNEPDGAIAVFGINSKYHPDFAKNPTLEGAIQIYKEQYWDCFKPKIDNMDQALAVALFDTAVNCGPGRAKEWLQKSNGDLNAFLEKRNEHYHKLAKNNPEKYGRYLNGWMNRMDHLEEKIAKLSDNQTTFADAANGKTPDSTVNIEQDAANDKQYAPTMIA